jgi:hypothetical protein
MTDDATWLAAELDADPAACRAAIDRKRQQAEDSGKPWRSVRSMVRNVIPLDEWRPLVKSQAQASWTPPTLTQCDGSQCPGDRHEWREGRNRMVCMGDAA